METRAAARRAVEQRRAVEEFTQEWLRRQGPGAAVALERIQNAAENAEHGDGLIEPGPVARATAATFQGVSPIQGRSGKRPLSPSSLIPSPRSRLVSASVSSTDSTSHFFGNDVDGKPNMKQRCITRSCSFKLKNGLKPDLFDKAIGPVVSSGFLEWYEFLRVGGVNRSCRALWIERRESYGPWEEILKQLNIMNCTHKCTQCHQVVKLRNNRNCCDNEKWNVECSKRKPDFIDCIDIVMFSGMLNWRQRGGIRRICKATYKVHKEQCTCIQFNWLPHVPFLNLDPRFQVDYYEWSDYEKCEALIRYTQYMIRNLHSFYSFRRLTDESSLPYGLAAWEWNDIQAINLQRQCPKRYAFVMNLVSLSRAQSELHQYPPAWFVSAFLGSRYAPYCQSFADSVASELTDQCLPPTDEHLVQFLRSRCYPTSQQQLLLGPLVNGLSIFSPLFNIVPLSEDHGPLNLPRNLETLNEQLIDSMSQHMICTLM